MLFFPLKEHLIDPKSRGIEYQDVYFETADNQKIHGWLLPQEGELKGTVLFFHGNGQNISTHLGAVYWLPQYGYQLIIVDYRGYGKSQGVATLDGAIADVQYSIKNTFEHYTGGKPFVVLGQSLGASLSVYALAASEYKQHVDGLVLVAPFSDYQKITREALSSSWLTWLFQIPLSWTINNDYKPVSYISEISPVPLYFIHGKSDRIILPEHSTDLYQLANEPKKLYLIDGGHNDLAATERYRQVILEVLKEIVDRKTN